MRRAMGGEVECEHSGHVSFQTVVEDEKLGCSQGAGGHSTAWEPGGIRESKTPEAYCPRCCGEGMDPKPGGI